MRTYRFPAFCHALAVMATKHKRAILTALLGLFYIFTGLSSAGLQDGLIAYYPFQGNADNAVGPAPNGLVSGAALAPDRFGRPNGAYAFDGLDDYVEVDNTGRVFDLIGSWTLACWVKPASSATDGRDDPLIWKTSFTGTVPNENDQDTFGLSWGAMQPYGPTGNVFFGYIERATDGEDFGVSSSDHPVGDWHHVVGSYDRRYLRIYVDGTLEQTSDIGLMVAYTGPAPLRIGNFQNSAHIYAPPHEGAFDGLIDDVYIYSRALTPTEVQDLYAIPEPATLALLTLGGLGLVRRRKRRCH